MPSLFPIFFLFWYDFCGLCIVEYQLIFSISREHRCSYYRAYFCSFNKCIYVTNGNILISTLCLIWHCWSLACLQVILPHASVNVLQVNYLNDHGSAGKQTVLANQMTLQKWVLNFLVHSEVLRILYKAFLKHLTTSFPITNNKSWSSLCVAGPVALVTASPHFLNRSAKSLCLRHWGLSAVSVKS